MTTDTLATESTFSVNRKAQTSLLTGSNGFRCQNCNTHTKQRSLNTDTSTYSNRPTLICVTILYKSANEANSAFHPFGVDKLVVSCNQMSCCLGGGGAIWWMLTGWMPCAAGWGGGVFASCLVPCTTPPVDFVNQLPFPRLYRALGCGFLMEVALYQVSRGCLALLEIYWNNFSLIEILEIYWKLAKSPENFLTDSKFLYFTVYQ